MSVEQRGTTKGFTPHHDDGDDGGDAHDDVDDDCDAHDDDEQ